MIKVGITGFGNLGRGVLLALKQNADMSPVAVFTRRDPSKVVLPDTDIPVISVSEFENVKNEIDVMILCGGSATDLPVQGPECAKYFNTVDSFDTHAKILEYFEKMDTVLRANGKIGIISVGWDPGLFSLNRLYMDSVLPDGKDYTFWGKGVSQGHSDAIRRVCGVKQAVQYTIPIDEVVDQIRSGINKDYSAREKHIRVCYVVAHADADKDKISEEIKNMPNYFSDYDTTVHFISDEEFDKNHTSMPHGGIVIRNGVTLSGSTHTMEFSLNLESNPEFTASVLVAYARAAYKLSKNAETGCRTVFDIPPALLSSKDNKTLMKEML